MLVVSDRRQNPIRPIPRFVLKRTHALAILEREAGRLRRSR
jgi:hypothetical protein